MSYVRLLSLLSLPALLLTLLSPQSVTRAAAQPQQQPVPALRVFFIDVEGGQATLFVTPGGRSLLIDTGWPGFEGRDADRIVAAAHRAGLKQIDRVLITHYHVDHAGGVPQLLARLHVKTFYDHGPLREFDHGRTELSYAAYETAVAASAARHIIVKPGDTILLDNKTLLAEVVSGAGQVAPATILPPYAGTNAGIRNDACASSSVHSPDTADVEQEENVSSLGVVLVYAGVHILDLGDLTWDKERELMCPINRLGRMDVLIVSHHGWDHSSSPALINALGARVAIMDNGATKGGSPLTFRTLAAAVPMPDLWQLHSSEAAAALNRPEQYVANPLGKDAGRGLELDVKMDGTFSMQNERNGFSKSY